MACRLTRHRYRASCTKASQCGPQIRTRRFPRKKIRMQKSRKRLLLRIVSIKMYRRHSKMPAKQVHLKEAAIKRLRTQRLRSTWMIALTMARKHHMALIEKATLFHCLLVKKGKMAATFSVLTKQISIHMKRAYLPSSSSCRITPTKSRKITCKAQYKEDSTIHWMQLNLMSKCFKMTMRKS